MREDHQEIDKLRKKKEKQQEKLMKLRKLNKKSRKGREWHQTTETLQTKVKVKQGARMAKKSIIKEKIKVDKLRKPWSGRKSCFNEPNTFNKKQTYHLSSTPDSSLSIQTPVRKRFSR